MGKIREYFSDTPPEFQNARRWYSRAIERQSNWRSGYNHSSNRDRIRRLFEERYGVALDWETIDSVSDAARRDHIETLFEKEFGFPLRRSKSSKVKLRRAATSLFVVYVSWGCFNFLSIWFLVYLFRYDCEVLEGFGSNCLGILTGAQTLSITRMVFRWGFQGATVAKYTWDRYLLHPKPDHPAEREMLMIEDEMRVNAEMWRRQNNLEEQEFGFPL